MIVPLRWCPQGVLVGVVLMVGFTIWVLLAGIVRGVIRMLTDHDVRKGGR